MNDMTPTSSLPQTIPTLQSASGVSIVTGRMAAMQRLLATIRLNDFGLPILVYNPEHIPEDLFERPIPDQTSILQIAANQILYEEGLPVIEGRLFWEQLPWEPRGAYTKFVDYRRLQEQYGYRNLNLLLNQEPYSLLPDTAANQFLEECRKNYLYYAWGPRTKAFDMVATVAYERLRERRAMDTENYHYLKLNEMFNTASEHWKNLNQPDSKAWNDVGIVDTVKILKDVMTLQRVAVGLPGSAPLSPKEAGGDPYRGHSMETRLKGHAREQASLEDQGANQTIDVDALLRDPKLLEMAQALILEAASSADLVDQGIDRSDEAASEVGSDDSDSDSDSDGVEVAITSDDSGQDQRG